MPKQSDGEKRILGSRALAILGRHRRLALAIVVACVSTLVGMRLQRHWDNTTANAAPTGSPAISQASAGSAATIPVSLSVPASKYESTPLGELAALVEACMQASRPVLIGSRDPKGPSCVQVVRHGELNDIVPSTPGDLNGGPGTTLATIYFLDRREVQSPLQDYNWHQTRLRKFLENIVAANRPANDLAHEFAERARRFWEGSQTWTKWPDELKAAGFTAEDDWPSYCLTTLDQAVAAKDLAGTKHWAGELAVAALSLEDLHRWLGYLAQNHLVALDFQRQCAQLFEEANAVPRKYDINGTISQYPAGLLSLNGQSNYYEVERQAERLFSMPIDGMMELASDQHLTPASMWVLPGVRESFLKLRDVLSPENRKMWDLTARTPYEQSYLINMLFRAGNADVAERLCTMLEKFDAIHPHARIQDLMSVMMYRGHSFGGLEWGDRFQPDLLKAAQDIGDQESDQQALEDAWRWTNRFYESRTSYGVTLTLRDALLQRKLDCVRATDMMGAIYRNAGRVGFGHVRWSSSGPAGHSVAAYLRPKDGKANTQVFDGLMPEWKLETWPECYFHGHAWPPSLPNNPPPYSAELYVRGIDSYIWAEGYIIRGPNAGTLTTAGIPYSTSRREASSRKVFDGPYPE